MSDRGKEILAKTAKVWGKKRTVDEFEMDVLIQSVSGAAREKVLEVMSGARDDPGQIGREALKLAPEIVAEGVCDPETGLPIFTPDQVEALRVKPGFGLLIQELTQEILEVSGLYEGAVEEAKKD